LLSAGSSAEAATECGDTVGVGGEQQSGRECRLGDNAEVVVTEVVAGEGIAGA
jgi:hypothetical protein